MIEDQPFKVRTWYGLPAEILVGRTWHWVRAGGLRLPHPGLVDIHLHQGVRRREREQLTYLHELGHLETLPLALLHALALWLTGRRRADTRWTLRLLIGTLAWLQVGNWLPNSMQWGALARTMLVSTARCTPD